MPINNISDDLKLRSEQEIIQSSVNKNNDYSGADDEFLAELFVKEHDDTAFNEIVRRYGDKIFRLALRITKNEDSAEEILQNVFIKLIEKLNTFREESRLSTWIYSVSSNESFLYIRNRNKDRNRNISVDAFSGGEDNNIRESYQISDQTFRPDDSLINNQQKDLLDNAINDLHDDYRVVFQLRDVEGLSNNEVADILGISLPAVKSRILRARNQLRKKLIGFFPEYQS